MNGRDVLALGVPQGPAVGAALTLTRTREDARDLIPRVLADPHAHLDAQDGVVRDLARHLVRDQGERMREQPAPYRTYGPDLIDDAARAQMNGAMRLPSAVRGALMPDAHVGYGLPIGGVMALEGERDDASPTGLRGQVSPYAVGVDIGCSMHLTVFAARPDRYSHEILRDALLKQTAFGKGVGLQDPVREHPLLDKGEWKDQPFLKSNAALHDTARAQLGSSGGGNHFASFVKHTGTDGQERLALLTHSGSRGLGAKIANHYSKLAMRQRPNLPKDVRHLAWLDLDTEDGLAYWTLMHLAGEYASANHRTIHHRLRTHLGEDVIDEVHNRHNYAWLERITTPEGEERTAVVHRKGATPAARGQQGIIPGSMATPAYVVRGLGSQESLNSASHGSGRTMSRRKAKEAAAGRDLKAELAQKGITLIDAGLDEAPEAYKSIEDVMARQADLIEPTARLDPLVVRMARD